MQEALFLSVINQLPAVCQTLHGAQNLLVLGSKQCLPVRVVCLLLGTQANEQGMVLGGDWSIFLILIAVSLLQNVLGTITDRHESPYIPIIQI